MEVVEIISHHIDKLQNVIAVEFKFMEDDDDTIREDFIEYSFFEEFGFNNNQKFEIFESMFDYEIDEWEDDGYDYVDETDLISFLNEYYIVYPNKKPKKSFK